MRPRALSFAGYDTSAMEAAADRATESDALRIAAAKQGTAGLSREVAVDAAAHFIAARVVVAQPQFSIFKQ